jgi:hypothetical protein
MITVFTNSTLQRSVETGIEAIQLRTSQVGGEGEIGSGIGPLETRYLRVTGAVEMFGEGPILVGKGYLNATDIAAKTDVRAIRGGGHRVHNAHVQYLVEGGIFAFISFVFITLYPVYVNVWGEKNAINHAFAASVGAIFLFMQSTTAHTNTGLSAIYMLILGCAVAYGIRSGS